MKLKLKPVATQLSAKREVGHLCAFLGPVILGLEPRIHSVMPVKDIILSEQTPKLRSRNGYSGQARA